MKVYRLTRAKYSGILSGKGSALKGARWNSTGIELIYTAGNRSLAMAEVAVHFTLATLPADYMMVTINIPDSVSVQEMKEKELPTDWRNFPHPISTQIIGDRFVAENKFCVLRIPSVVTLGDYNLLINPKHRDFVKIKMKSVEKFPFDKRILR